MCECEGRNRQAKPQDQIYQSVPERGEASASHAIAAGERGRLSERVVMLYKWWAGRMLLARRGWPAIPVHGRHYDVAASQRAPHPRCSQHSNRPPLPGHFHHFYLFLLPTRLADSNLHPSSSSSSSSPPPLQLPAQPPAVTTPSTKVGDQPPCTPLCLSTHTHTSSIALHCLACPTAYLTPP